MSSISTITKLQKGPYLRLTFKIESKDNDREEINTTVFSIDGLAKVRFKFKCQSRIMIISTMKQNLEKNLTVKMHVTCKALNYSEDFVCSEKCTDMQMGNISANYDYSCKTYRSELDVDIIVTKVKKVGFENLYEDTDFTDFHLSATDGRVAVHRACLGAHSDVFRRMLTSEWMETEEGCIELKGVSVQTLQHFKAYMYLGILPDDNELYPLLLLASQYMIQDLKEQCITKLAQAVKPDNFQCLMDFVVDNKMTDLILAIAQLTPDDVVHDAHEIKKRRMNPTSPENTPSNKEYNLN